MDKYKDSARNFDYWSSYWVSLFSGAELARFGFSLISPRVILREIDNEVTRKLKNGDNRRFLFDRIKDFYSSDSPSQKCLRPILCLLLKERDNPRLEIISQLCKNGLRTLDKYSYYDSAVDYLKDLLIGNSVHYEQLKIVSQDLIVELLEYGYSEEFIGKIPELLSKLKFGKNSQSQSDCSNNTNGSRENSDSQERLSKISTNLVTNEEDIVSSRIDYIKTFIRIEKTEYTYIFQLKGVKGDESINIGNIRIYQPKKESVLFGNSSNSEVDDEIFKNGDDGYVNVLAKVFSPDAFSGVSNAKRNILKALNCIKYCLGGKASYELGLDFIIYDSFGDCHGKSYSADRKVGFYKYHESLELNIEAKNAAYSSELFRDYLPQILEKCDTSLMEGAFMNSLHWYRKGIESQEPEDKLLFLWICIENLIGPCKSNDQVNLFSNSKDRESVVFIAFELLPRIKSMINLYDRGWLYVRILSNRIAYSFFTGYHNIPSDVLDRSGLSKQGVNVSLKDFIDEIPNLVQYLNDHVMVDNLNNLYDFYYKEGVAMNAVKKDLQDFRSDAVMLYRMRNKIVHGGVVGDNLLPYFVRSAESFARQLLQMSLQQFFRNGNVSPEGIASALYMEYDILLDEISTKGAARALFER